MKLLGTLVLFSLVLVASTQPNSCSLQYGTYTTNEPFLGYMNSTISIDNKLNRTSYIVQWYQNWGDGSGQWSNVLGFLNIALNFKSAGAAQNHMALLTWQPWGPHFTKSPAEYPLTAIANGTYDSYIDTWVTGISKLPYAVYLRPLHEMDGDWYPWGQIAGSGNTNTSFINAWRHIYSRFAARGINGTKNAKFVWCPNNSNTPGIDQTKLYPGDAYVDWICLDAYASDPKYSFRSTISENCNPPNPYQRLTNMTQKPLMIAEFGVKESTTAGTNYTKQAWFNQLNKDLQALPRIKALVYFNSGDYNYSTSTGSIDGAKAAFGGCSGAVYSSKFTYTNFTSDSESSVGGVASSLGSWAQYLSFLLM